MSNEQAMLAYKYVRKERSRLQKEEYKNLFTYINTDEEALEKYINDDTIILFNTTMVTPDVIEYIVRNMQLEYLSKFLSNVVECTHELHNMNFMHGFDFVLSGFFDANSAERNKVIDSIIMLNKLQEGR